MSGLQPWMKRTPLDSRDLWGFRLVIIPEGCAGGGPYEAGFVGP